MNTSEVRRSETNTVANAARVDWKIEVVVIPVADADRAKEFYARLGWRLDADFHFDNGFRVIQFTPPGSGCSVQFGTKITPSAPGSAQGLYLTTAWYWDLNEETRAFGKRFFAKMKREPTMTQAAYYSATLQYLKAVKAVGSTDSDKVMAELKKVKIDDMFTKNGYVRADGLMVHSMYVMQVKTPAESKYPWDYYKLIKVMPAEEAYGTQPDSSCSLGKK